MTIQTKILENIFTEMKKHGFSHVAYGTIFEKDGVEVYFGEYDSHVYSLSSQSFDGPEGNHHTKCTIHKALVYVHWSESYESKSKQMAERAVKLAEKH